MANVKISQLTAKGSKIASTDRVPIAQDTGGGTFASKYVTGAEINEVLLDTSPQLGGDLDVNTRKITSASNGNIKIEPNGTGAVLIGGNDTQPSELRFMELLSNGSSYVGFKAPADITTSRIYTLPTEDGTNGQVLQTNGSGTLSWFGAKKYVALLSQTGTSAPTATVLDNTLGGTLVWSYDGVGSYIGTLTGAFTLDKTSVMISGVYKGSASGLRKTNNTVQITTTATSTNTEANALLDSTTIEIKVYP
jgi:hypothetical protein